MPGRYVATTRVEINPSWDLRFYDPRSMQDVLVALQSPPVLSKVAGKLSSETLGGERSAESRKFDMTEAITRLKRSLCLTPAANAAYFDISVVSEDPFESKQIVDAVADTFCDWRPWRFPAADLAGILEQETAIAEQAVNTAQSEVNRLKAELDPPTVLPVKLDPKWQLYREAQQRFERAKTIRMIWAMRLSTSWLPDPPIRRVRNGVSEISPTAPIALGIVGLFVSAVLLSCGTFLAVRNW